MKPKNLATRDPAISGDLTAQPHKLAKRHIDSEWSEAGTGDGYWVSLKTGWKSADDRLGALHSIHEETRRQCYAVGVFPCECENCAKELARFTALSTP